MYLHGTETFLRSPLPLRYSIGSRLLIFRQFIPLVFIENQSCKINPAKTKFDWIYSTSLIVAVNNRTAIIHIFAYSACIIILPTDQLCTLPD